MFSCDWTFIPIICVHVNMVLFHSTCFYCVSFLHQLIFHSVCQPLSLRLALSDLQPDEV